MLLLGLLLSFSLVAAACGDDDDTTSSGDDGATSSDDGGGSDDGSPSNDGGSDVSGEVNISGSSTVEPISVRVAELLEPVAPDVSVTVDGPGTGDGFALFCEGATDISDASRAIKDEEAATCDDNGIEWIELQVAIDGMSVMTSTANSAVDCLSFEQIYGLVGPESTGFGSWADANSLIVEIGGEGNLPEASLEIYGPGEESGTFDSFIEIVLEGIADERGQDATTRPDYNPSADDNVIISGIQASDTSFGWVGYAFARNASDVKLLEVDGGDGCVAPTEETIASAEFPIARPLFIYVNAAKAAENPAVAAYVDFYMSEEGLGTAVTDAGYVPLGADAAADTRATWDNR